MASSSAPENDEVKTCALHMFNTICLGCIKEIKGLHEDVRAYFKKHMKVYHKDSDQYLRAFWDEIGSRIGDGYEGLVTRDPDMQDRKIIGGLALRDVLARAQEDEHPTVEAYIHMLNAYAYLFMHADDMGLVDATNRFVELLSRGEDTSSVTNVVLDDRALVYLRRIAESDKRCKAVTATEPAEEVPSQVEEIFNNSRLGRMAKEISASIDLSELGIDAAAAAGGAVSHEEALASLLQNEKAGQVLGQVISKVGQSITSRLENGEMTHMDLVSDALGMMSQLGSFGGAALGKGRRGAGVGDLVKSMATLFSGAEGGGDLLKTAVDAVGVRQRHGKVGSMIRREEMRKRLEERRAATETSTLSKTARSPR